VKVSPRVKKARFVCKFCPVEKFHAKCENFARCEIFTQSVQLSEKCTEKKFAHPESSSVSILCSFCLDSGCAHFFDVHFFVQFFLAQNLHTFCEKVWQCHKKCAIFFLAKSCTLCVKVSRSSKSARLATNLNDYGDNIQVLAKEKFFSSSSFLLSFVSCSPGTAKTARAPRGTAKARSRRQERSAAEALQGQLAPTSSCSWVQHATAYEPTWWQTWSHPSISAHAPQQSVTRGDFI